MEYWDIYDKDKQKINKIVKRGEKLEDNEYHLVVNVWIKNKNNEFLIAQRIEDKSHPLMWECVGGSAVSGEDSITTAIREVKEELGIQLNQEDGKLIGSTLRYYPNCPDILDVWLFEVQNIDVSKIKMQVEEVNDFMFANPEKIKKLKEDNKFEANAFFEEALKL